MTAQSITRGRPKKTQAQTVKAMVAAGMTEREIAKTLNKSKTAIHATIHRNFTPEEIESFKTKEADALREFRMKYINMIDLDDIKGMIQRRGMVDYGVAYDKEMHARGLGDDNKQPLVIINSIRIDSQPIDNSQIVDVNDINPLNNVVKSIT